MPRRVTVSGAPPVVDNCDVVRKLIVVNAAATDNVVSSAASATATSNNGGLINFATTPLYCHQDSNFLTQVKGYA